MQCRYLLTGLAFLVLSLGSFTAWADEPQRVGAFGDWTAYRFHEKGVRVCFIMSKPQKTKGTIKKRGATYVQIMHRLKDKTPDVVTFKAGYIYRAGYTPTVRIDDHVFKLFTDGEQAWAPDAATDRALVEAMQNGHTMTLDGTSSKSAKTTDTYSLKGATAAYKAISKTCGFKS